MCKYKRTMLFRRKLMMSVIARIQHISRLWFAYPFDLHRINGAIRGEGVELIAGDMEGRSRPKKGLLAKDFA